MADRSKCFANVKAEAKKLMEGVKDTDIDHFINKVLDTAERIKAIGDAKAAAGESFKKVVKNEMAEYLKAHKIETTRHLLEKKMDMAKQAKMLARLESFGGTPKEAIEILESGNVGGTSAKYGEANSASQKALVLKTKYIRILNQLKHKNLYDILASGEKDLNVAREVKELATKEGKPGISKDVDALEIAKVVHRFNQELLLDKQDAGILVRNMPGYIGKQLHDKMRIAAVDVKDWATKILPLLDPKTFKPGSTLESKMSFLEEIHKEITEGKKADASGTENFLNASRRKQSVAHGMSSSRALHFKDATAWHSYNQEFGSKTIYESIFRSITDDTRKMGLVDKWGTDPASMHEALRNKIDSKYKAKIVDAHTAIKENTDTSLLPELEKDLKKAEDTRKIFLNSQKFLEVRMKEASGGTSVGADNLISNTTSGLLAWNASRTLGGATTALTTDLGYGPFNISTGTGEGFFPTMVKNLREYGALFSPSERTSFFEAYDIHSESTSMAIHNDVHGDAVKPGMMAKGLEIFFKSIGLSQASDTGRFAVTKTLATVITNSRNKEFGFVSKQLGSTFDRYEITQDVWNIIRQGVVNMEIRGKNIELISPSGIRTLEMPQGVDPRMWRRQTEDAAQKLSMYLNETANYTSMSGTAKSRSTLLQGTESGTVIGAIVRLGTQLKTPAIQTYNALRLGILNNASVPHSSAIKAIADMNNVKVLAQFIPTMLGLGYASLTAKAFIKGETPPDPTKWRVFQDLIIRSGMGGLYADFLLGEYDRTFRNATTDLIGGPTGQVFNEVEKLWSKYREKDWDKPGTGDVFKKDAFNFMLKSIPGNNHLILRPLLDAAILDDLNEEFSLGYENRRSRRLEEERGSQLLWR